MISLFQLWYRDWSIGLAVANPMAVLSKGFPKVSLEMLSWVSGNIVGYFLTVVESLSCLLFYIVLLDMEFSKIYIFSIFNITSIVFMDYGAE